MTELAVTRQEVEQARRFFRYRRIMVAALVGVVAYSLFCVWRAPLLAAEHRAINAERLKALCFAIKQHSALPEGQVFPVGDEVLVVLEDGTSGGAFTFKDGDFIRGRFPRD